MDLTIQAYDIKDLSLWDDFVLNHSENGTIFHTRKFLSYHSNNQFIDHSILILSQNKLIAILLAAKVNNEVVSHPGTSGGGVVFKQGINTSMKHSIYTKIKSYYSTSVSFLIPEEVFFTSPVILPKESYVEKEISMYLNLNSDNIITNSRLKTGIKSCSNLSFNATKSKEDYSNFYSILVSNLKRYNSDPTHSLNELLKLQEILLSNMFLFLAKDYNKVVAGVCVIKANNESWHTQYIARDYSFSNQYILSALIKKLEKLAKSENQKILSLGSCNGGKNKEFSESLYQFKQKLGSEKCFRYKIKMRQ